MYKKYKFFVLVLAALLLIQSVSMCSFSVYAEETAVTEAAAVPVTEPGTEAIAGTTTEAAVEQVTEPGTEAAAGTTTGAAVALALQVGSTYTIGTDGILSYELVYDTQKNGYKLQISGNGKAEWVSEEGSTGLKILDNAGSVGNFQYSVYESVSPEDNGYAASSKFTTANGSVIGVIDHYRLTDGVLTINRNMTVISAGANDKGFMVTFPLRSSAAAVPKSYKWFAPGTLYGNDQDNFVSGSKLAFNGVENSLGVDTLGAPLIFNFNTNSGYGLTLYDHTAGARETVIDDNQPQSSKNIVDESINLPGLGIRGATDSTGAVHTEVFHSYPGYTYNYRDMYGNHTTNTYPAIYRFLPVKEDLSRTTTIKLKYKSYSDFNTAFKTVWRDAYSEFAQVTDTVDLKLHFDTLVDYIDRSYGVVVGRPYYGTNFDHRSPDSTLLFKNISIAWVMLAQGWARGDSGMVERARGVITDQVKTGATNMTGRGGGECLRDLFRAYQVDKAHGIDNVLWYAAIKSYADGLPDTPDYYQIPILSQMYDYTKDPNYLAKATKAGDAAWNGGHNTLRFRGALEDYAGGPTEFDREAGYLALDAYMALYNSTKDNKWLDIAKVAADYCETWNSIQNLTMDPKGSTKGLVMYGNGDLPPYGLSTVHAGSPAGDPYQSAYSLEFYQLYKATGDQHYMDFSAFIEHNSALYTNLGDRAGMMSDPIHNSGLGFTNEFLGTSANNYWNNDRRGAGHDSNIGWLPACLLAMTQKTLDYNGSYSFSDAHSFADTSKGAGLDAYYEFVSKADNKPMDMDGSSIADGASVVAGDGVDTQARSQQWLLKPLGDGSFKIINRLSAKALNIKDNSGNNGAEAIQSTFYDDIAYKFKLVHVSDGWYRIENLNSSRVLEVNENAKVNGRPRIQQNAYNGSDYQLWRIQPIGDVKLISKTGGKALDIKGQSTEQNSAAKQAGVADKSDNSQRWAFAPADEGYFGIVNRNSGLALGIENADTTAGKNAVQRDHSFDLFNGFSFDEQWRLEINAQGYFSLVSRNSGKALSSSGTAVTQENYVSGNDSGLWHLYTAGPASSSASQAAINKLEDTNAVTAVGSAPVLPATVTAGYSDGTTAEVSVVWDAIDPASYGSIGRFDASGTVSGSAIRAKVHVEVVPFLESFNNANNWTAGGKGSWSIANGEYVLSGLTSSTAGYSFIKNSDYADFVLEADITLKSHGNGGLMFRASNNDANGYYVGLEGHTTKYVCGKQINGSWNEFVYDESGVITTQKNHVKAIANGRNIKVFIRDMETPIFEINDSSCTHGAIGLRAYEAGISFDNIVIKPIPKQLGVRQEKVNTYVGVSPALPSTVCMEYDDGSVIRVPVAWSTVDAGSYSKAGSFTVSGTVNGYTGQAEAVVNVLNRGITAVEPVSVMTKVAVQPALPQTVSVNYDDGSTGVSGVSWNTADPQSYSQPGEFSVEGTVQGTDIKATATVKVILNQIASINTVRINTANGTAPVLPATVTAVYEDGTTGSSIVAWDPVDPSLYQKSGYFVVQGTVEKTELKAKAYVSVALFKESFPNRTFSGWTTYAGTWTVGTDYMLGVSSRNWGEGEKAVVTGSDYSDFIYEADFTVTSGNDGGLLIRASGLSVGGNGYIGYYIGFSGGSNAVLIGKVNNSWSQVAYKGGISDIGYNKLMHVKVIAKGRNIKVYVNDMLKPAIEYTDTDASYFTSGLIGVRGYNCNYKVGNIYIKSVPAITRLYPASAETLAGVAPVLPSTVKADLEDGTTAAVSVKWDNAEYDYTNPSFTVNGTVEGTDIKAVLNVTVKPASLTSLLTENIVTQAGVKPQLPDKVKAVFSDGSKKDVEVVWDNIPESKYAQTGMFRVLGTVSGSQDKAMANVIVVKSTPAAEIQGFKIADIMTPVGTALQLPSAVTAVYSDTSEKQVSVAWDGINPSQYASEGTFEVLGNVSGTALRPSVRIHVYRPSSSGTNTSAVPQAGDQEIKNADGKITVALKPAATGEDGTASAVVSGDTLKKAMDQAGKDSGGVKNILLQLAGAANVKNYSVEMPADIIPPIKQNVSLGISTPYADIAAAENMLGSKELSTAKNVALNIGAADKSALSDTMRTQIGSRPVVRFSLKVDGSENIWSNQDAPVRISVPYAPTAEELKNPDSLTVWYIADNGTAAAVPTARYDADTGKMVFSTTHLGTYAVVRAVKTFSDIAASPARTKIEALASKGIVTGTGNNKFSPNENLTRGQFMVMLVNALGLTATTSGNFSDVRSNVYYAKAVAIARQMGITSGTGKGKFSPEAFITRQDMMVLTAKALAISNGLKPKAGSAAINKFSDGQQAANYAKQSIAALADAKVVSGAKLRPRDFTTREEMADIIYNAYMLK